MQQEADDLIVLKSHRRSLRGPLVGTGVIAGVYVFFVAQQGGVTVQDMVILPVFASFTVFV